MAVYPVRVLYNSNCTLFGFCFVIIELLRIYFALFLPLINPSTKPFFSFTRVLGGSLVFGRAEFYSFRCIFLPVCLFVVVFDMQCSKITLEQVKPSHAPSATSNASPSCSRAVATSRRGEVHDAIDAEAHLPTTDGDGSCSETSVL
jgi:hypothetical protein